MAQSVHHLDQTPDPGGLRSAEVPQVVNPHTFTANGLQCRSQMMAEDRVVQMTGIERVGANTNDSGSSAHKAVEVVLDVGTDMRRDHHNSGLTALGGVDAALAPVSDPTTHVEGLAPSPDVLTA